MSKNFYDDFSLYYHLIFDDWQASIDRQAVQIDQIIKEYWPTIGNSILDVSCGIGTQALGLAARGYQVTGSDLSSKAIARARQEAKQRQLEIPFSVANMTQAFNHHQRQFDAVICCDNSIPHLLSREEILNALTQFNACLVDGGACLISIRDYDNEICRGRQTKFVGSRYVDGKNYTLFQTWDVKGEQYELSLFVVIDDKTPSPQTLVYRTQYFAIGTGQLINLLQQAKFRDVQIAKTKYYQPVIIATK